MKVCALTSGPTIPSARYRVRQYIPYLKNNGIEVAEKIPLWNKFDEPSGVLRSMLKTMHLDTPRNHNRLKFADRFRSVLASNFYDVTWIQKVLIPYHLTLELRAAKPLVFDLDDAIWLDEGKGFAHKIVSHANLIFAGNNYLADWSSQYNKNVVIIPTAVDTQIYHPRMVEKKNRFVVGWMGTSSNFKYVVPYIQALKQFFGKRKDVVLRIIADRYPVELIELERFIEFVIWDPIGHVDEMRKFSVGLMPIEDDEWAKGKCSYKMLQYMAIAIPVIVSPYGMNKELLGKGNIGFGPISTADWVDALESLYLNESMATKQGLIGLKVIQAEYNTLNISEKMATQFLTLV